MQFVNQPCLEVLLNRGDAAAEPDVSSIRSLMSTFQGGVNPIGHEMKSRSSIHGDRCARMMGQDEHRDVIRWVASPPALPCVVGPRTSNGPEHVTAHNPGTNVSHTALHEVIINSGCASLASLHLRKRASRDHPIV